jgi:hypothetical protein
MHVYLLRERRIGLAAAIPVLHTVFGAGVSRAERSMRYV